MPCPLVSEAENAFHCLAALSAVEDDELNDVCTALLRSIVSHNPSFAASLDVGDTGGCVAGLHRRAILGCVSGEDAALKDPPTLRTLLRTALRSDLLACDAHYVERVICCSSRALDPVDVCDDIMSNPSNVDTIVKLLREHSHAIDSPLTVAWVVLDTVVRYKQGGSTCEQVMKGIRGAALTLSDEEPRDPDEPRDIGARVLGLCAEAGHHCFHDFAEALLLSSGKEQPCLRALEWLHEGLRKFLFSKDAPTPSVSEPLLPLHLLTQAMRLIDAADLRVASIARKLSRQLCGAEGLGDSETNTPHGDASALQLFNELNYRRSEKRSGRRDARPLHETIKDPLSWVGKGSGAQPNAFSPCETDTEGAVLTAVTKVNLRLVWQAEKDPTPVLLVGNTGTAKTFTVMLGAKQCGRHPVRINMHSQISDEELFGKWCQADKGGFEYVLQAFATAYRDGGWLLLDELNLAPATVFTRIETALTGDELLVHKSVIRRHPDFRLFATMNPDTGKWASMRSALTGPFVGRFRRVHFEPLPEDELCVVVTSLLGKKAEAHSAGGGAVYDVQKLAGDVVQLAGRLEELFTGGTIRERGNYIEVTIREVLRWVDALAAYPPPEWQVAKAAVTWVVFGARLRTCEARRHLLDLMKPLFGDPHSKETVAWVDEKMDAAVAAATDHNNGGMREVGRLEHLRTVVERMLLSPDFYNAYGIYTVHTEFWEDIRRLFPGNSLKQVHEAARQLVAMVNVSAARERLLAAITGSPELEDDFREHTPADDEELRRVPVVVTDEVGRQLRYAFIALQLGFPVLCTGKMSSGKTKLLTALMSLLRRPLETYFLTKETDASELIGRFTTDSRNTKEITWVDGVVTRAVRNHTAVLLENLGNADAKLLERLNPVLERDPQLILLERQVSDALGERPMPENVTQRHPPLERGQRFCVLATLTSAGGDEVSPALYDRFVVIDVPCAEAGSERQADLGRFVAAFVSDASLRTELLGPLRPVLERLSNHQLTRLLQLMARLNGEARPFGVALVTLFPGEMPTFEKCSKAGSAPVCPPGSDIKIPPKSGFVVPEGQKGRFDRVCCCLRHGVPLLLNGPPAVGKTEMVTQVAKCRGVVLETVVNSASTTVNDYYGSHTLHASGEVRFAGGPLVRALTKGYWLFVDEINLALPEVLNTLLCVLDGQVTVLNPITGGVIHVHHGFRLIAAQNPTTDQGRQRLPPGLLVRFTQIDFDAFSEEELSAVALCHKELQGEEGNIARYFASNRRLTLRHLSKLARRLEHLQVTDKTTAERVAAVGGELGFGTLAAQIVDSEKREALVESLHKAFDVPASERSSPSIVSPSLGGSEWHFAMRGVSSHVECPGLRDVNLQQWPEALRAAMVRLAFARREPVLLVGGTCYKSLLAGLWAEATGRRARVVYLTGATEGADLLGSVRPYTPRALVEEALGIMRNAVGGAGIGAQGALECCEQYAAVLKGTSHVGPGEAQPNAHADPSEVVICLDEGDDCVVADGSSEGGFGNFGDSEEDDLWGDDGTLTEASNVLGGFADTALEQEAGLGDAPLVPVFNEVSELEATVAGDAVREEREQHSNFVSSVREFLSTLHDTQSYPTKRLKLLADELDEVAGRPSFLFRDGPVPATVAAGGVLVLEDFSLAPAAVIERLNPLAETDPRLELPEDVSLSSADDVRRVGVHSGFQIIGTCCPDELHKLSPATLSRYTLVPCDQYSDDDIRGITGGIFAEAGLEGALDVFEALRCVARDEVPAVGCDLRLLLRWAAYACHGVGDLSQCVRRLLFGARVHLAERAPSRRQMVGLLERWRVALEGSGNSCVADVKGDIDGILSVEEAVATEDTAFGEVFKTKDRALCIGSGVRVPLPGGRLAESVLRLEDPLGPGGQRLAHVVEGTALTANVVDLLERLFACLDFLMPRGPAALEHKEERGRTCPVLVEGPPARGKSSIVELVGAVFGQTVVRINFSGDTTTEDLFGTMRPCIVDGARVFQWVPGCLALALEAKKVVLLLDELNLADPYVLDAIAPLLDASKLTLAKPDGGEWDLCGVTIFATMNPASTGGGRRELSPAVQALFSRIVVEPYTDGETVLITQRVFKELVGGDILSTEELRDIIAAFLCINKTVKEGRLITGSRQPLNLRDLYRLRELLRECLESAQQKALLQGGGVKLDGGVLGGQLYKFIRAIFVERFRVAKNREALLGALHSCEAFASRGIAAFDARGEDGEVRLPIVTESSVQIGDIHLDRAVAGRGGGGKRTGKEVRSMVPQASQKHPFVYTPRAVRDLERVAAAVTSHRPALVSGPTCAGKTAIVVELARLCNKPLLVIGGQDGLGVSDLIGSISPDREPPLQCVRRTVNEVLTVCVQVLCMLTTQVRAGVCIASIFNKMEEVDWEDTARSDERAKQVEGILDAINTLVRELAKDKSSSVRSMRVMLSGALRQLRDCREQVEGDWVPSFSFEEARFVQALRDGEWILFENVNAVQQEVVERLLPLLEERPTLDLYESGEERVLKLAAAFPGEEVEEPIHPDARLFFTADMDRSDAFPLSAPFVNRLNQVPLVSVEGDSEGLLLGVCGALLGHADAGVVGAIRQFHAHCAKDELSHRTEQLVRNSQLSFRDMLQALHLAAMLHGECGFSLGNAVADALVQTYTSRVPLQKRDKLHTELCKQIRESWVQAADPAVPLPTNLSMRAAFGCSEAVASLAESVAVLERKVVVFASEACSQQCEQCVLQFAVRVVGGPIESLSSVRGMLGSWDDAGTVCNAASRAVQCLPRVLRNARLADWRQCHETVRRVENSATTCATVLTQLGTASQGALCLLKHLVECSRAVAQRLDLLGQPASVVQVRCELQTRPSLVAVRQTFDQLVFSQCLTEGGAEYLIRFAQRCGGIADNLPEDDAAVLCRFVRSFAAVAQRWRVVSALPLPVSLSLVECLQLCECAVVAQSLLKRASAGDCATLLQVLQRHRDNRAHAAVFIAASTARLSCENSPEVISELLTTKHKDLLSWYGAPLLESFEVRFALGVAYLRALGRLTKPITLVTADRLPDPHRAWVGDEEEFDVAVLGHVIDEWRDITESDALPRVTVFRVRRGAGPDSALHVHAVCASDPLPTDAAGIARKLFFLDSPGVEGRTFVPVTDGSSEAHLAALFAGLGRDTEGVAKSVGAICEGARGRTAPGSLLDDVIAAAETRTADPLREATSRVDRLLERVKSELQPVPDTKEWLRGVCADYPYATCALLGGAEAANDFVRRSIVASRCSRVAEILSHVVTTSACSPVATGMDMTHVKHLEHIVTTLALPVDTDLEAFASRVTEERVQGHVNAILGGNELGCVAADLAKVVRRVAGSTFVVDLAETAPQEQPLDTGVQYNRNLRADCVEQYLKLEQQCTEEGLVNLADEIAARVKEVRHLNVDAYGDAEWGDLNSDLGRYSVRVADSVAQMRKIVARTQTVSTGEEVTVVEPPNLERNLNASEYRCAPHASPAPSGWNHQLGDFIAVTRRLRRMFASGTCGAKELAEFSAFRKEVFSSTLAGQSYGSIVSALTVELRDAPLSSMRQLHESLLRAVPDADRQHKLDEVNSPGLQQPLLVTPLLPLIADVVLVAGWPEEEVVKVLGDEIAMSKGRPHGTGGVHGTGSAARKAVDTLLDSGCLVHHHPRFRLAVLAALGTVAAKQCYQHHKVQASGYYRALAVYLGQVLSIVPEGGDIDTVLSACLDAKLGHHHTNTHTLQTEFATLEKHVNPGNDANTKCCIVALGFVTRSIGGAVEDVKLMKGQGVGVAQARVAALTRFLDEVRLPSQDVNQDAVHDTVGAVVGLVVGELDKHFELSKEVDKHFSTIDLQLLGDMVTALAREVGDVHPMHARHLRDTASLLFECIDVNGAASEGLSLCELRYRCSTRTKRVGMTGELCTAFGTDLGLDFVVRHLERELRRVGRFVQPSARGCAAECASRSLTAGHCLPVYTTVKSLERFRTVLIKGCTSEESAAFTALCKAVHDLLGVFPGAGEDVADKVTAACDLAQGKLTDLHKAVCVARRSKRNKGTSLLDAYFTELGTQLDKAGLSVRNATLEVLCHDHLLQRVHACVAKTAHAAWLSATDGNGGWEDIAGAPYAAQTSEVPLEALLPSGRTGCTPLQREAISRRRTEARVMLYVYNRAFEAVCSSSSAKLLGLQLGPLLSAPEVLFESEACSDKLNATADRLVCFANEAAATLLTAVGEERERVEDNVEAALRKVEEGRGVLQKRIQQWEAAQEDVLRQLRVKWRINTEERKTNALNELWCLYQKHVNWLLVHGESPDGVQRLVREVLPNCPAWTDLYPAKGYNVIVRNVRPQGSCVNAHPSFVASKKEREAVFNVGGTRCERTLVEGPFEFARATPVPHYYISSKREGDDILLGAFWGNWMETSLPLEVRDAAGSKVEGGEVYSWRGLTSWKRFSSDDLSNATLHVKHGDTDFLPVAANRSHKDKHKYKLCTIKRVTWDVVLRPVYETGYCHHVYEYQVVASVAKAKRLTAPAGLTVDERITNQRTAFAKCPELRRTVTMAASLGEAQKTFHEALTHSQWHATPPDHAPGCEDALRMVVAPQRSLEEEALERARRQAVKALLETKQLLQKQLENIRALHTVDLCEYFLRHLEAHSFTKEHAADAREVLDVKACVPHVAKLASVVRELVCSASKLCAEPALFDATQLGSVDDHLAALPTTEFTVRIDSNDRVTSLCVPAAVLLGCVPVGGKKSIRVTVESTSSVALCIELSIGGKAAGSHVGAFSLDTNKVVLQECSKAAPGWQHVALDFSPPTAGTFTDVELRIDVKPDEGNTVVSQSVQLFASSMRLGLGAAWVPSCQPVGGRVGEALVVYSQTPVASLVQADPVGCTAQRRPIVLSGALQLLEVDGVKRQAAIQHGVTLRCGTESIKLPPLCRAQASAGDLQLSLPGQQTTPTMTLLSARSAQALRIVNTSLRTSLFAGEAPLWPGTQGIFVAPGDGLLLGLGTCSTVSANLSTNVGRRTLSVSVLPADHGVALPSAFNIDRGGEYGGRTWHALDFSFRSTASSRLVELLWNPFWVEADEGQGVGGRDKFYDAMQGDHKLRLDVCPGTDSPNRDMVFLVRCEEGNTLASAPHVHCCKPRFSTHTGTLLEVLPGAPLTCMGIVALRAGEIVLQLTFNTLTANGVTFEIAAADTEGTGRTVTKLTSNRLKRDSGAWFTVNKSIPHKVAVCIAALDDEHGKPFDITVEVTVHNAATGHGKVKRRFVGLISSIHHPTSSSTPPKPLVRSFNTDLKLRDFEMPQVAPSGSTLPFPASVWDVLAGDSSKDCNSKRTLATMAHVLQGDNPQRWLSNLGDHTSGACEALLQAAGDAHIFLEVTVARVLRVVAAEDGGAAASITAAVGVSLAEDRCSVVGRLVAAVRTYGASSSALFATVCRGDAQRHVLHLLGQGAESETVRRAVALALLPGALGDTCFFAMVPGSRAVDAAFGMAVLQGDELLAAVTYSLRHHAFRSSRDCEKRRKETAVWLCGKVRGALADVSAVGVVQKYVSAPQDLQCLRDLLPHVDGDFSGLAADSVGALLDAAQAPATRRGEAALTLIRRIASVTSFDGVLIPLTLQLLAVLTRNNGLFALADFATTVLGLGAQTDKQGEVREAFCVYAHAVDTPQPEALGGLTPGEVLGLLKSRLAEGMWGAVDRFLDEEIPTLEAYMQLASADEYRELFSEAERRAAKDLFQDDPAELYKRAEGLPCKTKGLLHEALALPRAVAELRSRSDKNEVFVSLCEALHLASRDRLSTPDSAQSVGGEGDGELEWDELKLRQPDLSSCRVAGSEEDALRAVDIQQLLPQIEVSEDYLADAVGTLRGTKSAATSAVDWLRQFRVQYPKAVRDFVDALNLRRVAQRDAEWGREHPLADLLVHAVQLVGARAHTRHVCRIDPMIVFPELRDAEASVVSTLVGLQIKQITDALADLGYEVKAQGQGERRSETAPREEPSLYSDVIQVDVTKLCRLVEERASLAVDATLAAPTNLDVGSSRAPCSGGSAQCPDSKSMPVTTTPYTAPVTIDGDELLDVDSDAIVRTAEAVANGVKHMGHSKRLTREELAELYKQASQRDVVEVELDDLAAVTKGAPEVEYRAIIGYPKVQELIAQVAAEMRRHVNKLREMTPPPELDICIAIDHSGSMVDFARSVRLSVTLLMEVLTKLECAFSVYGFWRGVTPLYNSREDGAFTAAHGQQALTQLSFSGGTSLLPCLDMIVKKAFSTSENCGVSPQRHNVMLLISDGFTADGKLEDHQTTALRTHKVTVGCLNIMREGISQREWLSRLSGYHAPGGEGDHVEGKQGNCVEEVNTNVLEKQPGILVQHVAALLGKMFPLISSEAGRRGTQVLQPRKLHIEPLAVPTELQNFPSLSVMSAQDAHRRMQDELGAAVPTGATFAFGRRLATGDSMMGSLSQDGWQGVVDRDVACAKRRYQERTSEEVLREAGAFMETLEDGLGPVVTELRTTFGTVFGYTRFTQRRPSRRGSSISLPGLIRALMTDFTDLRLFAERTAGGVRDRSFALALDVSLSCRGHIWENTVVSALATCLALSELGIQKMSIVSFGEKVRLVKPADVPWSEGIVARLLSLSCEDRLSDDASALRACMGLMDGTRARHVFMFTDGFGSSPDFGVALAQAERTGVDVVGVSVGYAQVDVGKRLGRYIAVAHPCELPEAFAALYSNVPEAEGSAFTPPTSDEAMGADHLGTLLEEIKSATTHGAEIVEARHSSTVDILFCIDLTESMTPFMGEVRGYLKALAKKLAEDPALSKAVSEMRFAFVCYRDFGDAKGPELSFTCDLTELDGFVDTHLRPEGGGDVCEHVVGGLRRAAAMFDVQSKTANRFMLLIGDGPQHGRECNGGAADEYPNYPSGVPSGHDTATLNEAVRELSDKKVFLIAAEVRPKVTKVMHERMFAAFPERDGCKQCLIGRQVRMFDDSAVWGVHFVFIQDASGSMSCTASGGRSRLDCQQDAVGAFMATRAKRQTQGYQDIVSYITFNSRSTVLCSTKPLLEAQRMGLRGSAGGGTYFSAGLGAARGIITAACGSYPNTVVLFLADGVDGSPEGERHTHIRSMVNDNRQLKFHSIAAYDAGGFATMRRCADVANEARPGCASYHETLEASAVRDLFVSVARGHDVVGNVAVAISGAVQDAVTKAIAENCY